MNWYAIVSRDITKIPDSINYYEGELKHAISECKVVGNIEKAIAAMPGMVEQRYRQLQEVEAILEYLNIEQKHLKNKFFRTYLEGYAKQLSSRDCEKYADGELEVVEFEKIINEFALLRNKWLGITKGLDQKSYSLSNITRMRCAGLEDANL